MRVNKLRLAAALPVGRYGQHKLGLGPKQWPQHWLDNPKGSRGRKGKILQDTAGRRTGVETKKRNAFSVADHGKATRARPFSLKFWYSVTKSCRYHISLADRNWARGRGGGGGGGGGGVRWRQ